MKKFILPAFTAILLLTIQSCDTPPATAEAKPEIEINSNDSLFVVNDGGYEFAIKLPKDLMIENTPSIRLNSATGELHITIGDRFWIVASQEKTDMATLKSEIDNDMLFSSRVIEENSNSLLYQRLLPDGSAYDYSFRNICSISGKPYIFKTSEEGEFSMDSVARMKEAIASVHAAV